MEIVANLKEARSSEKKTFRQDEQDEQDEKTEKGERAAKCDL
jgi:hypothetical protein